jgi:peptidyl-prolyl cis-trans isomerase SurA
MTKSISFLAFIIFTFTSFFTQAQGRLEAITKETVGTTFPIFSYGDKMVYNDEFMRVFNKNKRDKAAPTQAEIDEYLDLYVKFKLKVEEAYNLQMDTAPSFISELAGYRTQLAQPYLTDKSVTEMLIKEAYNRSLEEVNASHLLINCSLDASPSDTLAAYEKALSMRSRVVSRGESFASVAKEFSDDPSAKTNEGNLGYFTAFQMIYPFENAAFTMQVGEVSMPVRTQFGYHLVYLQDRRKSFGDIKVAHLMIKYYNEGQVDSAKQRAEGVYAKLKAGGDWNQLVEEFSEDFNTNAKGGELSWFNRTTGNIPTEFKDIAYTLKNNGDYAAPIKTKFGWHIVKRVDMKELPTYDESKDAIRRKVERDSRSELNKDVVVSRVKVENKYKELAGFNAVKGKFTDDLLKGNYEKQEGNGTALFSIMDQKYTDTDFYAFAATNQSRSNKALDNAVADLYTDFVRKSNLDYELSMLEVKYDDFKNIMQEYKDGILLFELTDNEVWSKAVEDSAGLVAFYEANTDKYMWKERADANLYSCKDAKTATLAKKLAKKGKTTNYILAKCNTKDPLAVKIEEKKFEKGSNNLLDKVSWVPGIYSLDSENDRIKFVHIKEIIAPTAKPLTENMGQATSDYQNKLEQDWIASLRAKYPVKIYEQNVKKLYN